MATRTPSAFSTTEPDLRPRKHILASYADDLLDDQQFVLEKNELVIGDQFSWLSLSPGGAWSTTRRYFTRAPHLCGTSGTINALFTMQVASNASNNFSIAIYHNGRAVRHSYTVTANHTSLIWRAWTACVLYGDGSENELLVQANAPYPDVIHFAGVCIITDM